MSQYSWVPVFQAITNELRLYENNQKQLIEWLLEIGIDKGLTDQTENREIQLEEIDPFTFFSMFMKYGDTQRRTYIERMLKKFKLNVQPPNDFMGVPSAQAQKVWLFPYKKNRGLNDVSLLWKLFNQAIDNNIEAETFAKVLKIRNVGFTKITQCLFYCSPEKYFPIDAQTKPFLKKNNLNIPDEEWESYQISLDIISEKFDLSFYELSYNAWKENTETSSKVTKLHDNSKDICLIGTWKSIQNNIGSLQKSIQKNGAWASWWSFVIGEEVQKKLKTPFYFYPNAGKGIFPVRLLVDEYETSRGNEGILSPWQEITNTEWQNKRTLSDKKSKIFKTWLRVTEVQELDSALTLEDFEPAKPFSNGSNLLNQNAFGYVYEKNNMDGNIIRDPGVIVTPYGYEDVVSDVFIEDKKIKNILNLLENKKNIILQGPPGVGKTFVAKKLAYALIGAQDTNRVQMIQFHQSYSYEDFIQGYRPSEQGFILKEGIFYKFCNAAKLNKDKKFVFIIDEINRGNLSKIFGELMMLIENDKRGSEWAMPLTYSDDLDDKFYVPKNIHFVGLMNTADRSLAMVDYALRRRFAFIDLEPSFDSGKFRQYLIEKGADEKIVNKVVLRIDDLNRVISEDTANLGKGFCIGHSYFCSQPYNGTYDNSWYEEIIRTEIEPLIREYWFDDSDKATLLVNNLLA